MPCFGWEDGYPPSGCGGGVPCFGLEDGSPPSGWGGVDPCCGRWGLGAGCGGGVAIAFCNYNNNLIVHSQA